MNIILVDRVSYFIDNILETTDWNIVVLITDDKNKYSAVSIYKLPAP